MNAQTGVLVYSKNLGFLQGESQEALLSGAISAVQVLLEEINVGPIEVIKTDQYRIILAKTQNLVVFLLGEFQNEGLVKALLQRIVDVFHQHEDLMTSNVIDSTEIERKIDQSIMRLFHQIEFQTFQIGVLIQEDRFGFKLLSGTDHVELDIRIIGYLSYLPSHVSRKTQIFTIPVSDTKIMTCLIYHLPNYLPVYALYSTFPYESLIPTLYNYSVFNSFGRELIDTNVDLLTNYHDFAFELHHIFFDASQLLKEQILTHPFSVTFSDDFRESLLSYFQYLPHVLPLLFLGEKIAVVREDLNSERFYMLLSTVAGFNLSQQNPYIRLIEKHEEEEYFSDQYAIVSKSSFRSHHPEYSSCFSQVMGEFGLTHQALNSKKGVDVFFSFLTQHTRQILDFIRDYLRETSFQFSKNLEAKTKSLGCFEYFQAVLTKINPHIFLL